MLDERRIKKDKSYPIIFRVVHNRVSTSIPTGYSVKKSNWNFKSQTIKKDCKNIPNADLFNKKLKQREDELRNTVIELGNDKLNDIKISELKQLIINKSKKNGNVTFIEFAEKVIQSLKDEGRIGTALSYNGALSFLKLGTKHPNLPFSLFSVNLLNKLESSYMSKNTNHFNGLAVYMRSLKAIYNRAIADSIVDATSYPFSRGAHDIGKYRIKTEKTKKRAIDKETIKKIENEAFNTENITRKRYLFYFMFSFYMRGMNFADMAKLTSSSIKDNTIVYRRSKTKRDFEISVIDKAKMILDFFEVGNKKNDEYIFPIIKHNNLDKIKNDITNNIKRTNKHLKATAKKLEITTNLTTYVSRHSWATIADKAGIDRRTISKGLGHADLQTTNIYIDDIVSSDDLAAADEIITA